PQAAPRFGGRLPGSVEAGAVRERPGRGGALEGRHGEPQAAPSPLPREARAYHAVRALASGGPVAAGSAERRARDAGPPRRDRVRGEASGTGPGAPGAHLERRAHLVAGPEADR